MVEFIRSNPAPEAFRRSVRGAEQSQAHESRQRRSRFDLADAERRQSNELARDAAIRKTLLDASGGGAQDRPSRAAPQGSGVPQGGGEGLRSAQVRDGGERGPSNLRRELSRSLSRVPGAGPEAANLSLQSLEADQQLTRRVFELASTGDPQAAIAFAQQNGQPVPPELFALIQDRAAAASVTRIFAHADQMFGNQVVNARRKLDFVRESLKGMFTEFKAGQGRQLPSATADARRVAESTAQPAGPIAKPGVNVPFPQDVQDQKLAATRAGRERVPVPGVDEPFSKDVFQQKVELNKSRGRGGGQMSVFEQKRQAFLSVFPGDMQGALQYAQGRRSMNDTELQLAAQRLSTQEMRGRFPAATSDEIDARARQIFDVLQATNTLGAGAGDGGGTTSTPDPNATGRTPAPNFTPVPGAPRSEAERPAPTATATPRPSRRPKVGDTVTANGRKLRVTKVLDGGRVEVVDPTNPSERFTARVK